MSERTFRFAGSAGLALAVLLFGAAGAFAAGPSPLVKAVKSGDPKLVRSAATNLNASCTDCHAKFRDEG